MIARKLDVTTEDMEEALAVKAPLGTFSYQLQRLIHLIWNVRDVVNDNIRENGQTPEPYTYLEGKREDYWLLR